jgi:hypothetical protein
LEFGEVPFGLSVFGVLGDETEGFEGFEAGLDGGFAAGGVFELGGDRVQTPFPSLCPQQVTDGSELIFEVFGLFCWVAGVEILGATSGTSSPGMARVSVWTVSGA